MRRERRKCQQANRIDTARYRRPRHAASREEGKDKILLNKEMKGPPNICF